MRGVVEEGGREEGNLPHYSQISGHFVACFCPLPRGAAAAASAAALANFDIFNCHCCCFSCCWCCCFVVVVLLLAVDFQLIFHFDISICQ